MRSPHLLATAVAILLAAPVAAHAADWKRGDVKLRGFLGRRFPAGSVIEVRVTRPGAIGAVRQIKIRNGKRPKLITRCLPPGAREPVRC